MVSLLFGGTFAAAVGSMPALGIDKDFGLNLVARWDAGQVKLTRDALTEINAFALVTESGLQVDTLPDGRWVVTYLLDDGTVGRKYAFDEETFA